MLLTIIRPVPRQWETESCDTKAVSLFNNTFSTAWVTCNQTGGYRDQGAGNDFGRKTGTFCYKYNFIQLFSGTVDKMHTYYRFSAF